LSLLKGGTSVPNSCLRSVGSLLPPSKASKMDFLKGLDEFSKPEKKGQSRKFLTAYGGALQVCVWVFVLTYTIVFVKQVKDSPYPVDTVVNPFPTKFGAENGHMPFLMPNIKCIATSGCFYVEEKAGAMCKWYAKNQDMPAPELVYSTMPRVSVLSMDTTENGCLAFDMVRMTKPTDPIQTEASEGWKFIIPRGLTTMNVERVKGIERKDGTFEIINTWLASLTSDISSFQEYGHGCCNQNVMVKDGATNNWILDAGKTTLMTQCTQHYFNAAPTAYWWTTRLVSPAYYTLVTINDPLSISTLLGYIGGWLGTITFIAAIFFVSSSYVFKTLGWYTPPGVGADEASKSAKHEAVPSEDEDVKHQHFSAPSSHNHVENKL